MNEISKVSVSDNDNRLTCGKCQYVWLEYRGLPPDKLTCPRCNANVIRRGLVQFSKRKQYPRTAIDTLYEILEFTSGDNKYQMREYKE
jgi:ribosomal protein S27AE